MSKSSAAIPPQVGYLLGNEAAERFSYYGMKQLLQLYLTTVLLRTSDQATFVTHLFAAANYMMPFLGGWVSDRLWGRYNTIFWVSLFYVLGHAVLAFGDLFPGLDHKALCLYVGLGLIAFGSGGIKPCVSAFLGDQFQPHQQKALTWAYSAFYWCINLGSFFALICMPAIKRNWGYGWAFGIPGIAMALAAIIFWLGRKHYVHAKVHREPKDGTLALVFAGVVALLILGQIHWPAPSLKHLPLITGCVLLGGWLLFGFWGCFQLRRRDMDTKSSVGRVMAIFMLVPVFWALFDQTFSTWITQGTKLQPYHLQFWGIDLMVGAEEMSAANPNHGHGSYSHTSAVLCETGPLR